MNLDAKRTVKSYVNRRGRVTEGQWKALSDLWPIYGIDFTGEPINLPAQFSKDAPLVLDIGFGDGTSLIEMASSMPNWHFVGVEVYRAGVGQVLQRIENLGLKNIRLICNDVVEVLTAIETPCLDRVQLFFPDPWPKKRHHKRRLVQPDFIRTVCRVLKDGGKIHCATDWEHYAHHMLEVMSSIDCLKNDSEEFIIRPSYRPMTKFERRGVGLGHSIYDLIFTNTAST